MHHSEQKKQTHFCSEWYIVGYGRGVHYGICGIVLLNNLWRGVGKFLSEVSLQSSLWLLKWWKTNDPVRTKHIIMFFSQF